MLNKEIRSALLYYTRPCLYYNGVATAEGTGFWTPEAKGPSSGVVASIVLIIIALSSVIVCFFLHNSQIVLGVLQESCTSKGLFKNHVSKIIKNPNFVIKL